MNTDMNNSPDTPHESGIGEDIARQMGESIRKIVRNRRSQGHSDSSIESEILDGLNLVAVFNGWPANDPGRLGVLAVAGRLTREALGTAGPAFRVVG
ncbi:hypothetical protein [Singulisphaera sp. PoT]|uniref:hypothetical protein n=1 Tax=Singulisphaera sp. PoT TaxID=3411797 RepID=UPI003BF52CA2